MQCTAFWIRNHPQGHSRSPAPTQPPRHKYNGTSEPIHPRNARGAFSPSHATLNVALFCPHRGPGARHQTHLILQHESRTPRPAASYGRGWAVSLEENRCPLAGGSTGNNWQSSPGVAGQLCAVPGAPSRSHQHQVDSTPPLNLCFATPTPLLVRVFCYAPSVGSPMIACCLPHCRAKRGIAGPQMRRGGGVKTGWEGDGGKPVLQWQAVDMSLGTQRDSPSPEREVCKHGSAATTGNFPAVGVRCWKGPCSHGNRISRCQNQMPRNVWAPTFGVQKRSQAALRGPESRDTSAFADPKSAQTPMSAFWERPRCPPPRPCCAALPVVRLIHQLNPALGQRGLLRPSVGERGRG